MRAERKKKRSVTIWDYDEPVEILRDMAAEGYTATEIATKINEDCARIIDAQGFKELVAGDLYNATRQFEIKLQPNRGGFGKAANFIPKTTLGPEVTSVAGYSRATTSYTQDLADLRIGGVKVYADQHKVTAGYVAMIRELIDDSELIESLISNHKGSKEALTDARTLAFRALTSTQDLTDKLREELVIDDFDPLSIMLGIGDKYPIVQRHLSALSEASGGKINYDGFQQFDNIARQSKDYT